MTIHGRTVAFRRHLPPNQSLLSLVGQSENHTHPHIAGNTRDEQHVKGLRLPKRRGLQSSDSQPQPKLRRPGHRCAHPWWGVKRNMHRTGTSKDLFESYLQEWLWRQHYGDDPFARKTLSSISPTYMRKYCSSIVPLYALFVM